MSDEQKPTVIEGEVIMAPIRAGSHDYLELQVPKDCPLVKGQRVRVEVIEDGQS